MFFVVEIQCQVQQFVGVFDEFCVFNQCYVQIDFGEIVKGDGFLNWIVCQWIGDWCCGGFYFFFRSFYQGFNLFYFDMVVQCFEWIDFMCQQWLLNGVLVQFVVEECFCMCGQLWQDWFQSGYQYVEYIQVYGVDGLQVGVVVFLFCYYLWCLFIDIVVSYVGEGYDFVDGFIEFVVVLCFVDVFCCVGEGFVQCWVGQFSGQYVVEMFVDKVGVV